MATKEHHSRKKDLTTTANVNATSATKEAATSIFVTPKQTVLKRIAKLGVFKAAVK